MALGGAEVDTVFVADAFLAGASFFVEVDCALIVCRILLTLFEVTPSESTCLGRIQEVSFDCFLTRGSAAVVDMVDCCCQMAPIVVAAPIPLHHVLMRTSTSTRTRTRTLALIENTSKTMTEKLDCWCHENDVRRGSHKGGSGGMFSHDSDGVSEDLTGVRHVLSHI